MTSLFPDLRSELVGAMERGPRSRRAPVALAAALIAVAIAVSATTLHRPSRPAARPAPTATATPQVPPAIDVAITAALSRLAPGSPVLQLRVGDGTMEWDTAAWGTTTGTISLTQAVAGARSNRWGTTGWGTFPIASELLAGRLAGLSVGAATKDGIAHYVVVGIVESRARGVTVTVDGRRQAAALSAALLTRPVELPAEPTVRERKLAKSLPREITVRLFAVAFEFRTPKSTVRPLVRVTRPDGTTTNQRGARYYVGQRP